MCRCICLGACPCLILWIDVFFCADCRCRLQAECTRLGIEIHRRVFEHIDEAMDLYPETSAVVNCTGLGALTLGGVKDDKMYSARVSSFQSSYRERLTSNPQGPNPAGRGPKGAHTRDGFPSFRPRRRGNPYLSPWAERTRRGDSRRLSTEG